VIQSESKNMNLNMNRDAERELKQFTLADLIALRKGMANDENYVTSESSAR